jgi:uncharacterized protein with HEPN domain
LPAEDPRDRRRLEDILACADELAGFIAGKGLDRFLADRVLQRATERLLTVIGEAAKQLSPATRAAIDQPWREIIRLRDKGIHAYDSLSPATLHRIAGESVPDLRSAIRRFLDQG